MSIFDLFFAPDVTSPPATIPFVPMDHLHPRVTPTPHYSSHQSSHDHHKHVEDSFTRQEYAVANNYEIPHLETSNCTHPSKNEIQILKGQIDNLKDEFEKTNDYILNPKHQNSKGNLRSHKNHISESKPFKLIRRYNHTYLDHLEEMPPELQDYINEHYNGKFIMASISPDMDNYWNESDVGNSTNMSANRPYWQKALDKTVTYIMTFNVVGLMLGMGCAIYWREVVNNLWPPIGIIIGMCGQFIILPATGFAFSILFRLQPYEALGCLVVSCSPGGSFSNFFTYWVEGDLALSIVMTACSSIIAFVGMPFNLWLYSSFYVGDKSNDIVIPYLSIVRALSFICGPVVIGMVIRHFSEKVAHVITKVTSIVGYLGFLIVLTSWIILYWRIFATATKLIYVSAIILPLTGFSCAYLVAFILRRTHKVCRTIGIETGSQNMPVALSIILLSFQEPEIRAKMILFPTLYGIFMLCEVFIGIGLWYSVKYCRNRGKEEDFPVAQKARLGNGSMLEKEKLNV